MLCIFRVLGYGVVYGHRGSSSGWRGEVDGDMKPEFANVWKQIFGVRNFLVNHIKLIGFIMFITYICKPTDSKTPLKRMNRLAVFCGDIDLQGCEIFTF